LTADGVVKEFKNIQRISMEIFKSIYEAKLPNVEQGFVNSSSITITLIGRRVPDALRLNIVAKQAVLE
jgi:hypothetical protein